MTVDVVLPLRIVSTANLREHWRARAARAKTHRLTAGRLVHQALEAVPLPCVVTMTRIAPRTLDDDNLASAFKSTRDGIADALGIKDNDPRVTWKYDQARGEPKQYAARIRIDAVIGE